MTPAPKTGLSLAEAVAAVVSNVAPLPSENVPLPMALGRALASSVTSPIDLPLWDNSGMDGYAVRRADVIGANAASPKMLEVIGTITAGSDAAPHVKAGTTARIMTGAPLPPGADAVVRIEDTDRGEERVRVIDDRDAQSKSGNVRARGEDMRKGTEVFAAGTTILPAHIGVLASVGAAMVLVHRAPRVVIVSTGDELVHVEQFEEVLAGRRIVSSSTYALPAWLASMGAEVRALPILPDVLETIRDSVGDALEQGCDLLITTGGVSVGAHDYTRDALQALGADLQFWRARIRPGGPIGVGNVRGVPWLGLPGNPVSTMVTAELFARPALRRLGGHSQVERARIRVRMDEDAATTKALTHLLRVVVSRDERGELGARLAGAQGSNLLRTMALANALLVVPEGNDRAISGEQYECIVFGELH